MTDLSKEQEVLLRLLRGEFVALPEGTDTGQLLELLRRHRLLPLSSAIREQLPEEKREEWKALLQQKTFQSLKISSETAFLIRMMKNAGVTAIPLKGAVLALMLYGDVGLRHFSDIDLLVERSDLKRVSELLASLNYVQTYPKKLSHRQERIYSAFKKDIGFYNREKQVVIELHYGIYVHELLTRSGEGVIRERRERIVLHNEEIEVLDRESTFLYLVYHGALHQYYRLFWLRDVAECMKRWELDHRLIAERVRLLGLSRMFAAGLLLAEHYFSLELPDAYSEMVTGNGVVQRLVKICHERIIGPEQATIRMKVLKHLYLFSLKPGLRYKFMVGWSILQRRRIRMFMGGH